MSRVRVGRLEDLPNGGCLRLDTDPPVSVFHVGGGFHAIDDTCSHEDASLADGWVEDCHVECPLHGSWFDLRTGYPEEPPAEEPVRVHAVVVEDGVVFVEVGAPATSATGNGSMRRGA